MRISSDATIFGAYVPIGAAKTVLDIGTGTGLLALMLAQRATDGVTIDAIEIEDSAFAAAKANVESSAFAARINVFHSSLQKFAPNVAKTYDLIVSNPPFFQSDLATTKSRSMHLARHAHDEGLDFATLARIAKELLAPGGRFWVLLPSREANLFRNAAAATGLHEKHRLCLHHTSSSHGNREISSYLTEPTELEVSKMVRHRDDLTPSDEMRALLAPYMLHY